VQHQTFKGTDIKSNRLKVMSAPISEPLAVVNF